MSIDIAKELKIIHDRITTQNSTMEAMWNRVRPLTKFYDWVKETHPDLLNQYVSIRELEEVSKDYGVALRGYTQAQVVPKAEGQRVNYDGDI